MTPTTATAAPPTCERRIWRQGQERTCAQVVGVTRWQDTSGTGHAACANHVAELEHRFPIAEPDWLHESKAYDDWLESEKREAFGG